MLFTKAIYKIEIFLSPDNTKDLQPFFWCLKANFGENWCTQNAGWEISPEAAWKKAYSFYKKYKFNK